MLAKLKEIMSDQLDIEMDEITEDKSFKDVAFGVGDLAHKEIVDTALEYNKPEWLIIEWEGFEDGNDLDAVKISIDNLKKLL